MAESDAPSPAFVRRVPGYADPPGASFTKAMIVGDEIVVSGLTARGPDGAARGGDDMEAQTRAIFGDLFAIVRAAGGHPGNIYKLVIYVTDMSRRGGVNAARQALFAPLYPASTLVGVTSLVSPDLLVEVDAFANLRADLRAAGVAG